jgi:NlpC/P60 family putative phage cell wall peptidase
VSIQRQRIVAVARTWVGTRYQHQASLRHVGCDCLGLLRGIWREVIGPEPEQIPTYPAGWMSVATTEILIEALGRHFQRGSTDFFLAGDVLIFRFRRHLPASHIAIATDQTSIIHAHVDATVAEVPFENRWRRRLAAVFSFPDLHN